MENQAQLQETKETYKYLLHYIGKGLYKKEDFAQEAEKIGVNRAFPHFMIRHLKWSDKILTAQYEPSKDKNEKGKAHVFGYFVLSGLNFDCENREEFVKELVSKINVVSGGAITPKTIRRKCGSYTLGAVYYVDEPFNDIIDKAVKIAKEKGIKIKIFLGGSFYSMKDKEISPISFTRTGLFVELDQRLEDREVKDKQIGFIGDYQQRKYFTKKDKEQEDEN